MRWGWIGLAIVSTIGYLWLNPLIMIVRLSDEEADDQMEPKDDDDEVENLDDEEVDEGEVLVDTEPEDGVDTETPTA